MTWKSKVTGSARRSSLDRCSLVKKTGQILASVENEHIPTVSMNANKKRKRTNDEDSRGDGVDDRPPKAMKSNSVPSLDSINLRFACPFRKRCPEKYNALEPKWRVCTTPFSNIPRLKEHLYRRHTAPKLCPRCGAQFESNSQISLHLTSIQACPARTRLTVEGVTDEMEQRLRSRKKTFSGQSEVERWMEIYKLLFPGDPTPASPFFSQEEVQPSLGSVALDEFEAFVREELPHQVRTALGKMVDEMVQPKIIQMIKDCQEQVFSRYKSRVVGRSKMSITTQSTPEFTSSSSISKGTHSIEDRIISCLTSSDESPTNTYGWPSNFDVPVDYPSYPGSPADSQLDPSMRYLSSLSSPKSGPSMSADLSTFDLGSNFSSARDSSLWGGAS